LSQGKSGNPVPELGNLHFLRGDVFCWRAAWSPDLTLLRVIRFGEFLPIIDRLHLVVFITYIHTYSSSPILGAFSR
jgi:hypothetical protein